MMVDEIKPHAFIQWKGTQVCMDVYCTNCGYQDHIDGDFVYYVRCLECNITYKVGDHVQLTPLTPEEIKERVNEDTVYKINDPKDDERV